MPPSRNIIPIIMAGGQGTRMNSDLPKVLHLVNGVPMIVRILRAARALPNVTKVYIVVGAHRAAIASAVEEHLYCSGTDIEYIDQPDARGTGHAIQCCLPQLACCHPEDNVLILSGDTPLLTTSLLTLLAEYSPSVQAVVATMRVESPTGYGRIVERNREFVKIVEEKDCDARERAIRHVNAGLYRVSVAALLAHLPHLSDNNAQKELYLTDIFSLILGENDVSPTDVTTMRVPADMQHQLQGVNTPAQLIAVAKLCA